MYLKHFGLIGFRPIRWALLMLLLGIISDGALASQIKANEVRHPIWATQFAWAPSSASFHIDYNSSNAGAPMSGAYQGTPDELWGGKDTWHIKTWKLTGVDFAGRQNFGADLRIGGSAGIAVHQLILSLRPPKIDREGHISAQGPSAGIIFDTGRAGTVSTNTDDGIVQLAIGGNIGDSRYSCRTVKGYSAEVFAKGDAVSYLYLRLNRQNALYQAHPKTLYATVLYAATMPPAAWSESVFASLAAHGIHYAEINMEWAAVEPGPGRYNFAVLDRTLENAAKAHVRVIPIFWYGVWGGNPASWITKYDVGPTGVVSSVPTWWSRYNRRAYFDYVVTTINHIKNSPGFGGVFLDFGWLDYMWGPEPGGKGVNGYAPQDVARFHQWLPTRYHSLSQFNQRYGTHFTTWNEVPAAAPGDSLFSVYQRFRNWSVFETYARLTALIRHDAPNTPLYYYWGGGFSGAGVAFNLPDTFFQLARRYRVTVVLDDADHTGLAILFCSLARYYNVPLFEEWTPRSTGLHAEIAEFLGHYGFGAPKEVGMDFFLYNGGKEYEVGYPQYIRWIPILSRIHGSYPLQPVAVYVSYKPAFTDPAILGGMANKLANMWRDLPMGFTVVTDREVAAGVVNLDRFRAILPLNGQSDPAMVHYASQGGHIVKTASELAQYASPYLTYNQSGRMIEAVPTVDRATRSAWITLSGWLPKQQFDGVATIHLAGLQLPNGRYHLLNAVTGKPIASYAEPGKLVVPLKIAAGDLLLWRILPGSGATLSQPPTAP